MTERQRGLSRRDLLKGLFATGAVLALPPPLLSSDTENLSSHVQFAEWRRVNHEVPLEYSALWSKALGRMGLTSTNEMVCLHRSNTLKRTQEACRGERINYLEVDLRLRGDQVVAAHEEEDKADMNLEAFHGCVGGAEEAQRPKIIKYDPKTSEGEGNETYGRIKDEVAQFNGERPYIMNFDPFSQYGYDVSNMELAEKCLQYPSAVWSVGYDGYFDEDVRNRIISLSTRINEAGGAFTLPIKTTVFGSIQRRDPEYFKPMVEAGVHFTFYYRNGDVTPGWTKDAIIESTLLPQQCIFDFK